MIVSYLKKGKGRVRAVFSGKAVVWRKKRQYTVDKAIPERYFPYDTRPDSVHMLQRVSQVKRIEREQDQYKPAWRTPAARPVAKRGTGHNIRQRHQQHQRMIPNKAPLRCQQDPRQQKEEYWKVRQDAVLLVKQHPHHAHKRDDLKRLTVAVNLVRRRVERPPDLITIDLQRHK